MTNEQREALMDIADNHLAATSQAMDDLNAIFSTLVETDSAMADEFRGQIIADVRARLIRACRTHDAAYESYKAARAIVFFGKAP